VAIPEPSESVAPPRAAEAAGAGSSDAALVAAVCGGEPEAFAELVRRYGGVARRTAVLLGAGADADDVVQEAFVKAYRGLGGFRREAGFQPWLLRIVANETRNAQRSGRRRARRESSPAALPDVLLPGMAAAADPAELTLAGHSAQQLWQQLGRLDERQRTVLVCRYLLDLDEAATAVVLGVARGTVKSRTSRALRRMRDLLAEPADTGREGRRG
jgi:RNA polymerase sigma-70 factor (ECF subfamily)